MKKILCAFLAALLVAIFPLGAFAAEGKDMTFAYELSIDGKDVKQVQTGDIITVVLYLDRTDVSESYLMNAMQSEIRYDETFFEIEMGSWILGTNIKTNADIDRDDDGKADGPIRLRDNHREFYMNFVSFSGGERWDAHKLIGSFRLKVIATTGVTVITNEDALVSFPDGSGSYTSTTNTLTVVLSEACLIRFESNGGSAVSDQTVNRGQTVTRPENPTKEGYYFKGWYKDYDCTEKWEFSSETVTKNMTLYAGWSQDPADFDSGEVETTEPNDGSPAAGEGDYLWLILLLGALLVLAVILLVVLMMVGRKIVDFETFGGTEVASMKVRKNGKLTRPAPPIKDGYLFGGWAKDPECTIPWHFDTDTVTEDMTLYARWK